uniref:Chy3a n=1 Tax=Tomicus yunnanensis TaxID=768153 RepID=A0A6B8V2D0_9CUCU|nr:Chy3a [Tomicus yunnanensis]
MVSKCFLMIINIALACTCFTSAQEIDLSEFATTLGIQDIPVRVPPSQFKFNRDRTPATISTRIIGGNVATANEYPYQVALYVYIQRMLYFCGGTLITQQWVLTAAHCAESATSIVIILGSHNLAEEEDSRLVYNTTTFIIHENWDADTLQNDIALIKLPKNIALTSYINTVPVANGSDLLEGLTGRCLGWGKTLLGSLSDVLRYVDVEVISNDNCSAYSDYTEYILDQHLCTSGAGIVGSCNGDSGGPLVVDGTQVGIVSFGASDCAAGLPSVFARTTMFYDWINHNIGYYNATLYQTSSHGSRTILPTYRLFYVLISSCIIRIYWA